jgi:murein DD-endopeptidase MepM/ murein hydrolase activator NlpD
VKKATLIWFSGPDKPFRSFTLSKRGSYAVLGVAGFVAFVTAVLFVFALSSAWDVGSRKELSKKVNEQSAEIEQLRAERDRLHGELDRIRQLEVRVRRFLGMEAGENATAPNQGGEGPSSPSQQDASPAEGPQSLGSSVPHSALSGLDDVLSFLEDKSHWMRMMPTLMPVRGADLWVSCYFGWRSNPFTGTGKEFHQGIDIAGPWKATIVASADGSVSASGRDPYLGEYVKIDHGNGIESCYGHLADRTVHVGAKVKRGDLIGHMGSTGRTTGVHLHYAISKNNHYIDPTPFIWDGPNNPLAAQRT